MNPALVFRDQIGRLSGGLQDELDQLVANIGTGWAVEHDDQGHHTDITASSVRANRFNLGKVFTASLTFAAASSKTLLGSGLYRATFNAVQVPDDTGIVLLRPDDDAANVDPAIDAGYCVGSLVFSAPPKNGDLLFVGQHANSVFPIQLLNLSSVGRENFKFSIPPKMQDPDASFGTFTLSGSPGLVPFVYLEAPGAFRGSSATATVLGAWTLLQTISSRTSPL